MMMKRWFMLGVWVVMLAAALFVWFRTAQAPTGTQACTMDAKICPDGSAVGRTGPHCEFAPCPTATSTQGTGGGGGIMKFNSGVEGSVSLGPTCPVMRDPPDPACADKPYATAIIVYRAKGTTPFIIGNSDKQGVFKFSLPPGNYRLSASAGTPLPRCADVEVTVPATGYVSTAISCDTGIR